MENNIGFTGTQDLRKVNDRRIDELWNCLKNLKSSGYVFFHHGDCIGADDVAATQAYRLHFKIIVHPPINDAKRCFHGNYMEKKEPKEYIERNHDIVDESAGLIALPKNPKVEELRSGTWATIRYAKSVGKLVIII